MMLMPIVIADGMAQRHSASIVVLRRMSSRRGMPILVAAGMACRRMSPIFVASWLRCRGVAPIVAGPMVRVAFPAQRGLRLIGHVMAPVFAAARQEARSEEQHGQ